MPEYMVKLMEATTNAVFVFLLIRLVVGFFGSDLYQIYWWFALGLTIALLNMNVWASARTEQFIVDEERVSQTELTPPPFAKRQPRVITS